MTQITLAQPIYELLIHHGSITTRVHSVFNAACNLQSPYGLISLLTQPKKMNPCAILLPQAINFKSLSVDTKVELSCSHNTCIDPALSALRGNIDDLFLHINLGTGTNIVSEQIERFIPSLPATLPRTLGLQSNIQSHIADFLQRNQKPLGIYPLLCQQPQLNIVTHLVYQPKMMAEYITPHLQGFIANLSQHNPTIALKSIIGFGAGLTPSMDDLLVGLLSWLDFSQHPYFYPLAHAVQANAAQTTDVSQAMLMHATLKQYNQEIVELYACLNQSHKSDDMLDNAFNEVLNEVIAYGHSSGHDTLCGIYLGLTLFGDVPID